MIGNSTFTDISFSSFSENTKEVLKGLFDESLLFRKDLIADTELADGRKEVLNFVYDEFREFLLASTILLSWQVDQETAFSQMDELIRNSNIVAEGLQRYLCSWAIRKSDETLLNFLRGYELFSSVFIENIFAIPDQNISDKSIEILTELFFESSLFSREIIINLISRCNSDTYTRLNINFVIEQISKMSIEQYNDLIQSGLLDEMQSINQGVNDAFRDEHVTEQSKPNILKFLYCLIGVKDENWLWRDKNLGRSPAISTILEIASYYSKDEISYIADSVLSKILIDNIRIELAYLVERLIE